MLLRALSHDLKTDRHGASIALLGGLFYCLTSLTVRKSVLMSNLNLLWQSFVMCPHILSSVAREKSPALVSVLLLPMELQRTMTLPPQLSFLYAGQSKCPQFLLPRHAFQPCYQLCCPPLDTFNVLNIHSTLLCPVTRTPHNIQDEALLNIVVKIEESILLTCYLGDV